MTVQCSHQLLHPMPMGNPRGLGSSSLFPVGWIETWTKTAHKAVWQGLAVPTRPPPGPRDMLWQGATQHGFWKTNFIIFIIAAGRWEISTSW